MQSILSLSPTFEHLKRCLTSAPTLAMPNWSQPFIIDTDASDVGIGAVLSQVDQEGTEHVIAYAVVCYQKQSVIIV